MENRHLSIFLFQLRCEIQVLDLISRSISMKGSSTVDREAEEVARTEAASSSWEEDLERYMDRLVPPIDQIFKGH